MDLAADDDIGSEGLGFAAGVVVDEIGVVGGGWEAEGGEEAMEDVGAVGDGAVAEEGIEDLATEHRNVLAGEECGAEVDDEVGGEDDVHAGDAAVDEGFTDGELVEHGEEGGGGGGEGGKDGGGEGDGE
ncbi:hypothetical protein IHE45_08G039200 [Dioscorea alata]|uniref:Uncharacterized protein n=1 Tax=Dioscorea alata TaxID=55571 RepID=A0ACB7VIR1_DIOAL|nr:hypothetical protein IHE45_08G039200 [Dioscorea alata]